jgi:hypothetical protein
MARMKAFVEIDMDVPERGYTNSLLHKRIQHTIGLRLREPLAPAGHRTFEVEGVTLILLASVGPTVEFEWAGS